MAGTDNQIPGSSRQNLQVYAHYLAQSLINAAKSGNPQPALESLRAERRQVLVANHGNEEATRAEMKQIRQAANKEAREYAQMNNLPRVVFRLRQSELGERVTGIARRVGENWQSWNPISHAWVDAKSDSSR